MDIIIIIIIVDTKVENKFLLYNIVIFHLSIIIKYLYIYIIKNIIYNENREMT